MLDRGINIRFPAGVATKHASDNFFAGESCKGEGTNELLGGVRHDDLNANAAVLQQTNNLSGFIGGNAATDSQGDFHKRAASDELRATRFTVRCRPRSQRITTSEQ